MNAASLSRTARTKAALAAAISASQAYNQVSHALRQCNVFSRMTMLYS